MNDNYKNINLDDYAMLVVQFSRGCPCLCEFCDITVMFGRRPRTKTPAQMLRELDAIYDTGFRGVIFIVFTFDHAVPGLTKLLQEEELLAQASAA